MSKSKKFGIGSGANKFAPMSKTDSSTKLPADILEGKTKETNFFRIPCDHCLEYGFKNEYDFSPWTEDKFQELVDSIEEFGVLHPIIVRPHQGKEGHYEILAGEHRWKASKQLNLETVPAQILQDCDDEKARCVFTLTNIINRELTLEDKIQGWSHYYALTKGKRQLDIEKLEQEGMIEKNTDNISKRLILRYHKINSLPDFLKQLVFSGVISTEVGEKLHELDYHALTLLSNYSHKITSSKYAKAIVSLYQGEFSDYDFDDQGLDYIFSKEFFAPKEESFAVAMKAIKPVLKEKISKENYQDSAHIVSEALDFYEQFKEDRAILEKALEQYKKTQNG